MRPVPAQRSAIFPHRAAKCCRKSGDETDGGLKNFIFQKLRPVAGLPYWSRMMYSGERSHSGVWSSAK